MPILLSTAYFPPWDMAAQYARQAPVWLEAHEHYQKRTWRNRALILSANGPLLLSIPLQKGKHQQQPIREVRIAYQTPWQRQHWASIASAYGSAPFFPHFADALADLYAQRPAFLFDWNWRCWQLVGQCLGLPTDVRLSEHYAAVPAPDVEDLRDLVARPQASDTPYYPQVFEYKFGFVPGLSVLDALFCLGPGIRF